MDFGVHSDIRTLPLTSSSTSSNGNCLASDTTLQRRDVQQRHSSSSYTHPHTTKLRAATCGKASVFGPARRKIATKKLRLLNSRSVLPGAKNSCSTVAAPETPCLLGIAKEFHELRKLQGTRSFVQDSGLAVMSSIVHFDHAQLMERNHQGKGDVSRQPLLEKIIAAKNFDAHPPLQMEPPVKLENAPDDLAPHALKSNQVPSQKMLGQVDAIRDYLALLDEYSLHHFLIWQGRTIESTPEHNSFRRSYRQAWGAVQNIINLLETLLKQNSVPLAIIDGKRVAAIAVLDAERVEYDTLLSCIANWEQVAPQMRLRTACPAGHHGSPEQQAAVQIQRSWRMWAAQMWARAASVRRRAATLLAACIRAFLARRRVKSIAREAAAHHLEQWLAARRTLSTDWSSAGGRVIVHIPTLTIDELFRISMLDLDIQQNLQLPRLLMMLRDPCLRIVYVSACLLPREVIDYQLKLLGLGREKRPAICSRLHVVVPEHCSYFPPHFPLSSVLYYSPECMNRIRTFIGAQRAFILPGSSLGRHEKGISLALRAPVLGADCATTAFCSSQCGSKRIFQEADVSIPLGVHDIFTEEDFFIGLSKLICCNLGVSRWVLKVNLTWRNRGIAFVDAESISCISDLVNERKRLVISNGGQGDIWYQPDVQLIARTRVLKELRERISDIVTVCHAETYPTWEHYVSHFLDSGGVIEAQPPSIAGTVSTVLFLTDDTSLRRAAILQYETLSDDSYEPICTVHPQRVVPEPALQAAGSAVARVLIERGVIGYVTLHFVAFWDSRAQAKRLWATGMEFGPGAGLCGDLLRGALTTKSLDAPRNPGGGDKSSNPSQMDTGQVFMYFERIHYPGMGSLPLDNFFRQCRMRGVSYDVDSAEGIAFNIIHRLSAGFIGMVASGSSRRNAMKRAKAAIHFICELSGGGRLLAKKRSTIGDIQANEELRRLVATLATQLILVSPE